eukprot:XP_001697975.1 predicted protein [Chlamydomonas reinhardtii]
MPVANATFVAGTNRRLPTPDKSGGFEGPPERILRLSFQVNELPVVLPSLVTRERWQEVNQDAALLVDAFLSNRQQLLAVFDGHGPEGHRGALWRAVESLDAQLAVSGIDVVNSGTTAAMCHVHGRALTAAGGSGWRVVWQSTDHKPELPAEAARIEAAGGRVARSVGPQGPVGPFRVWFKKQIGVVATPSTAALTLPPEGRPAVLVLASDGVWELMSNEQVLALAGNAGSAAEAASRVVQQSRRAWVKEYGGSYIDDITAVVVRFNMPPTARAQTLGAGAAGAAGSKL